MAFDWARSLRGGMAGAAAAGAWAAQQPLDKRLFGSPYDDVELLGKAVTTGPAAYPVGLAIHLANGAAFGAVYAALAPRIPLPAWSRGPLVAQLENFSLWPLGRVVDHVHPARGELPALSGNHTALAQSTWRHLVFGIVLGELERRLNPREESLPPDYDALMSTNGHGSLEDAVATGAASSP
jgi:hypothetical protein